MKTLIIALSLFMAVVVGAEEDGFGAYGRYYYTKDGKQMCMFDYITTEGKKQFAKEGLRPATQEEIQKFWDEASK